MSEKVKETLKGVGYVAGAGLSLGLGIATTILEGPYGKIANNGRKSPMNEMKEQAADMWKKAGEHFDLVRIL